MESQYGLEWEIPNQPYQQRFESLKPKRKPASKKVEPHQFPSVVLRDVKTKHCVRINWQVDFVEESAESEENVDYLEPFCPNLLKHHSD